MHRSSGLNILWHVIREAHGGNIVAMGEHDETIDGVSKARLKPQNKRPHWTGDMWYEM
jgi:hypothetical protein